MNYNTIGTINSVSNLLNGISNGISSYYFNKVNGYQQRTELYNQSISLYQQVSAKIREEINQQANAYMNSGVDISQGTSLYVITHKQQQGQDKINEIVNNIERQSNTIKKVASSQAIAGLVSGIVEGISNSTNTLFNNQLAQIKYNTANDTSNITTNNQNLYNTDTKTESDLSKINKKTYILWDTQNNKPSQPKKYGKI